MIRIVQCYMVVAQVSRRVILRMIVVVVVLIHHRVPNHLTIDIRSDHDWSSRWDNGRWNGDNGLLRRIRRIRGGYSRLASLIDAFNSILSILMSHQWIELRSNKKASGEHNNSEACSSLCTSLGTLIELSLKSLELREHRLIFTGEPFDLLLECLVFLRGL